MLSYSTVVDAIIWVSFAMIWIAIAFWPARIAARKGHNFVLYLLLSLLFFPLGLIAAGLAKDRTNTFRPTHASTDSIVPPP